MIGLRSQYGFNLILSVSIGLLVLGVAIVAVIYRRSRHRSARPIAARILTAGSVAVIFAATALPNRWPIELRRDGDLILRPGMGGLRSWSTDLLQFPDTLASILLVANVVAYVPLGSFAAIGWAARTNRTILLGILGLSLVIELIQFTVLGRVASTDDVILNMLGGLAGVGLGRLFLRIAPSGRRRSPYVEGRSSD